MPGLRIVVAALGSPGFVFPAIAVARALRDRGHRVTVATEPWAAAILGAQGLSCLPAPAGAFDTSRWFLPSVVAAQSGALRGAGADLFVVTSLTLGGLIAAELAGVPCAVIGLLSEFPPPQGANRQEIAAAWSAARAAVYLPPAPIERLAGDRLLRRGVPELFVPPAPGPSARFVGALGWEPPAPPVVRDWIAASSGPILYVHQARTFGAPGFWRALAPALPPGVRVATSTSRMDHPERLPAGALAGPVVPHGAVLDHAAACICSGTSSVVLAALERGVPLVVVPAGGEQPDVADLVERAGVGVRSTPDTPSLAAALARAQGSDPGPRAALRRAFASLDGPSRAAQLVLELVHSAAEAP